MPAPGNPQSLNRYAYVTNNPLRYTDPSGHWLETAWDIANIGWDIYEVYRDPGNAWNWVALAMDVGAAVLPAVPAGVGLVVRGGKAAKAAVEVASHADGVVDAAHALSHADEAADIARTATNLAEHAIEVVEITNPLPRTQRFARALPENVARLIEAGRTDIPLGKPGDPDVFITAAEDLARYRTQASVERRLALQPGRRAVVTFKYDVEAGGIASPVFRDYPGFVGKGRTLGGAREWVIPNKPLRDCLYGTSRLDICDKCLREAEMQCQCAVYNLLSGHGAEQYVMKFLDYVTDRQGWVQLWQCHECGAYWEMNWEGGGGFDNGVMTLRRLSKAELTVRWPDVKPE